LWVSEWLGVGNAQAQFLPHALEWVWKGYAPKKGK
jgi:enterochelin esterase family protein